LPRPVRLIVQPLLFLLLSACASLTTGHFADKISAGIVNLDDLDVFRQGAPAYLIMIEGFIESDPEDIDLLITAARLYGSYAAVVGDDTPTGKDMVHKAYGHAFKAVCVRDKRLCSENVEFTRFASLVSEMDRDDVPLMYAWATAWSALIERNRSDWSLVADLPKVKVLLERILVLDERFDSGQAHLYLAVIESQLPAALGGRPDDARRHFERAIELSAGRNLIAKVEYARHYARLVFDRKLHDRLLHEVVDAKPEEKGLTLSNVYAQQQARALLDTSNEYFGE